MPLLFGGAPKKYRIALSIGFTRHGSLNVTSPFAHGYVLRIRCCRLNSSLCAVAHTIFLPAYPEKGKLNAIACIDR